MSRENARNQVYLTKEEWETLISQGYCTLASGEYITYSPNDTYYIPEEVATTTNAGLMSSADKTKLDGLSQVATTGDYNDLSNKPTIPTAGTTATAVSSSSSGGSATTFSKSDHTHNIVVETGDNDGQVKVAGQNVSVKGLGSNAYTSTSYQPTSTAVSHTASTAVGSATKPVYVASNGVATACTYSLAKDVPANAVFTDTTYTAGSNVSISATNVISATNTTYGIANSSNAGLVKSATTGTTANRTYNVEVNSDGTMKVNVPWTDNNTTYTAEKGISLSGTKFGHSNTAITAQTTQAVYPIKIDAYGHITSYGTAVSIPVVNNPTISFTQGGVSKGSFTLNQSGNATIALDAGGGGSVSLYAHNINFYYSTGGFTAQIITNSATAFTHSTLCTWLVGKGYTSTSNAHTASGVATTSGVYKGVICGLIGNSSTGYTNYVYCDNSGSKNTQQISAYGFSDSVVQII